MNDDEPQWELTEKVVAILEKALTPTAIVEHNVKLPVLGKPDRRPRQCDVVITYGKSPRQSITIVEVQDRTSKPEITTFHGWVEKMREVGAQQLICVSVLGFPQSIIDEVSTQFGPTVKLMTLKQLKEATVQQLIFVVPYVLHKHPHISFEPAGLMEVENPPQHIEEFELNPNEKVFSMGDNEQYFSLIEFVDRYLKNNIPNLFYQQGILEPDSYSLQINFRSSSRDLWFHLEESRYKVINLPIKIIVETSLTKIPLKVQSYEQQDINDTLAWIVTAKGQVDERDLGFQLVFKPNEEGFLNLSSIHLSDMSKLDLFISPSESAIRRIIKED